MTCSRDLLLQLHADCAVGVYRFLWSLVGEESAASDLLQEVFVKVAKDPAGLAAADCPRGLAFTIARRSAMDWHRRNRVRVRAQVQLAEMADAFVTPDDPDAAAMQRALTGAMDKLPSEQREVVHLHLWEGLTFRIIGTVQGVTTATAASRYRYGIAAMQATLQSLYSELYDT